MAETHVNNLIKADLSFNNSKTINKARKRDFHFKRGKRATTRIPVVCACKLHTSANNMKLCSMRSGSALFHTPHILLCL